jgi:hypothetical protein
MWRRHEGEIVWHLFGWRIRVYLGHTSNPQRRIRTWRSDLGTIGIYVVPWCDRVIGAQWRSVTSDWRRSRRKP